MGSIIMSGAYIGKNSIIAAGTMIPQGKIIMDNSLVIGNLDKLCEMLQIVK